MSFEFEDSDTLSIDAEWLDLLNNGQCIKSPQRPVPKCRNLKWWISCYPNGNTSEEKRHVSVFIETNIGGFEKTMTVALLRSDVQRNDTDTYVKPARDGWATFVSHEELRSSNAIKNGVFVIKCDIQLKIPQETMIKTEKTEEDICVVKFDRKSIDTFKVGQAIEEEERTFKDIKWWVQYYPAGKTDKGKHYVSLYYYVIGGPVRLKSFSSMSINGVHVCRNESIGEVYENSATGWSKMFSHKQCLLADHNNDIIDIVCKITIDKSADVPLPPAPTFPTTVNDVLTATFLECQLSDNEIGEFDSTPKEFVKGSDKHQWCLQYFPAGDGQRGKRHISLFIDASTTETKTVTLTGVVKIANTTFEKKFNMLVESDSYHGFPKLISHEELKRIGGIVDSKITIICEAVFTTHEMALVN